MKRSTDRILTTHAGSLPRPQALIDANVARAEGRFDAAAFAATLRDAVADVARRQAEAGDRHRQRRRVRQGGARQRRLRPLDDLRLRAPRRLGARPAQAPASPQWPVAVSWQRFADFYAELSMSNAPRRRQRIGAIQFTGPDNLRGAEALEADLANLKAALAVVKRTRRASSPPSPPAASAAARTATTRRTRSSSSPSATPCARSTAPSSAPASSSSSTTPACPTAGTCVDPEPSVAEYRSYAGLRIEALEPRPRRHPGGRGALPHLLGQLARPPHHRHRPARHRRHHARRRAPAPTPSKPANVRHEHEWKVWQDVKLPDGKLLIPGVVSHATNVVEHPRARRRPHRPLRQHRRPRERHRRHRLRPRRPHPPPARLGQAPRPVGRRRPRLQAPLALKPTAVSSQPLAIFHRRLLRRSAGSCLNRHFRRCS